MPDVLFLHRTWRLRPEEGTLPPNPQSPPRCQTLPSAWRVRTRPSLTRGHHGLGSGAVLHFCRGLGANSSVPIQGLSLLLRDFPGSPLTSLHCPRKTLAVPDLRTCVRESQRERHLFPMLKFHIGKLRLLAQF